MFYISKDVCAIENLSDINDSLLITERPFEPVETLPEYLTIYIDCEWYVKNKKSIEGIGLYCPQLNQDYSLAFVAGCDDFSKFNAVTSALKGYGIELQETDAASCIEVYANLVNECFIEYEELAEKSKQRAFTKALKEGFFDEFCNTYKLSKDALKIKVSKSTGDEEPIIKLPEFNIELSGFFMTADLFKSFNQSEQEILKDALLKQFRTFTISKGQQVYYTHPTLGMVELNLQIRDTFARIPPLSDRSLNGNLKALGCSISKLNIETDDFAQSIGVKSGNEIKMNMGTVRQKNLPVFTVYMMVDVFATHLVDVSQQHLLDRIRDDFELVRVAIRDTTGANVSRFICDLVKRDFTQSKDDLKLLQSKMKEATIGELSKIDDNILGIQGFLTVGGLLFSRTPKHPVIRPFETFLSDLDLSSCYATRMACLNVYYGTPVISINKHDKYKRTLKELSAEIKHHKLPRDGWLIRISGKIESKYFNTLVLSDLRYEPKTRVEIPSEKDIKPNRKSIEKFNFDKVSKREALSVMLTKEVKFGLINADILDVIENVLPEELANDFLNMKVDFFCYFPPELICDDLEEMQEKIDELPEEDCVESFTEKGMIIRTSQYSKKNVCLRFDISQYWQELKTKRAGYKKVKDPIQEIYKLVGNSGYGVMACVNLPSNNPIAANQITAAARVATWLKVYSLNGFNPITDGTTIGWDYIPLGQTFKSLLETNPEYLISFDPSIKSGLSVDDLGVYESDKSLIIGQQWIDEKFMNHQREFFGVGESFVPLSYYSYELKTENYEIDGLTKETTIFNLLLNTNAGNYIKAMDEQMIVIDGTDYDIAQARPKLKARSFRGKDKGLIDWYCSSLLDGYTEPFIYSESEIIKFSDANQLAIKMLTENPELTIAHPMGFSRQKYKAMKLISRSQFLFQTEVQLRNFEKNEAKLAELSKELMSKRYWQTLETDKLEQNPNIDYWQFAKTHSTGIGWEVLTYVFSEDSPIESGSIQSVREVLFELINEQICVDFNSTLHLSRFTKTCSRLINVFTKIIVLKANAEYELHQIIINSANEEPLMIVSADNIKTYQELKDCEVFE